MTLPTRVAKLLALPQRGQRTNSGHEDARRVGAQTERSRTSSLDAALVKAVETLVLLRNHLGTYEEGRWAHEAIVVVTQACEKMEGKAE